MCRINVPDNPLKKENVNKNHFFFMYMQFSWSVSLKWRSIAIGRKGVNKRLLSIGK